MVRPWLVLLLVACAAARASGELTPDEEIARRHFEEGARRYSASDYQGALTEFEAARRVNSAPALDFNIARCHDRLEHFREAVGAYRRYVSSRPTPADAAEVRARIATLEERTRALEATAAPLPPPPPPAPRRGWIAGVLVAVVAVVGLAVGLGVGLAPRYPTTFATVPGN
jgi:hypothetical protein